MDDACPCMCVWAHTQMQHTGPSKINQFTQPVRSPKSQGVRGTTSARRWARLLPRLSPGRADGGRRQPPSLTHPAVRHLPSALESGEKPDSPGDWEALPEVIQLFPHPREWSARPDPSPQQLLPAYLRTARPSDGTSLRCQGHRLPVPPMPPVWTAH